MQKSVNAWNSKLFCDVLKQEICALEPDALPLQQGLSHSSYAIADKLSVTILNIQDDTDFIIVKAGLFYTGVVAGCNCADDPTPVDENNEYCEIVLQLNKKTADAIINLVD